MNVSDSSTKNMKAVKHALQKGVKAQPGVEF